MKIDKIIELLNNEYPKWQTPAVTILAGDNSPFKVLISCIISLRTKDEVTAKSSKALFYIADTASKMMQLSAEKIADLIYPAGFYKRKGEQIAEICKILVEKYDGKVPDDIDELLKLKGVGRKTANLVVTLGYNKLGICVDTHVHRICNRFGYVVTKTPEETEKVLRTKLPQKYWMIINDLLVAFGQNHCHPVSPRCSSCVVAEFCQKVGVKHHR